MLRLSYIVASLLQAVGSEARERLNQVLAEELARAPGLQGLVFLHSLSRRVEDEVKALCLYGNTLAVAWESMAALYDLSTGKPVESTVLYNEPSMLYCGRKWAAVITGSSMYEAVLLGWKKGAAQIMFEDKPVIVDVDGEPALLLEESIARDFLLPNILNKAARVPTLTGKSSGYVAVPLKRAGRLPTGYYFYNSFVPTPSGGLLVTDRHEDKFTILLKGPRGPMMHSFSASAMSPSAVKYADYQVLPDGSILLALLSGEELAVIQSDRGPWWQSISLKVSANGVAVSKDGDIALATDEYLEIIGRDGSVRHHYGLEEEDEAPEGPPGKAAWLGDTAVFAHKEGFIAALRGPHGYLPVTGRLGLSLGPVISNGETIAATVEGKAVIAAGPHGLVAALALSPSLAASLAVIRGQGVTGGLQPPCPPWKQQPGQAEPVDILLGPQPDPCTAKSLLDKIARGQ